MGKKIEFEIIGQNQLHSAKCDFHPDSDFLLINDGYEFMWCLECLYKILKEHNSGQWSVENVLEKES